jgi:hypothetical protein
MRDLVQDFAGLIATVAFIVGGLWLLYAGALEVMP